jgi:hypothetical protein
MKGTLEYDLNNIDDQIEMKRAMKATDMALFIWELKHNFWRKWKHDDSDFNLETWKEALYDLLDEHNINVDELTN